mmetsp:Transcript_12535/g.22728  ORF Transcript_12535/g.22728 Transcript_12535/m.22728 type:complete len:398 (-) Transcript_12535:1655-2848(-)|eukprot:CAMPEP_0203756698 /NCGR_PEP_ID=MMETSP0098-20131031/9926_1 /ASSEMBLY_ACC=CAM_ASM_000208 /TAXON_ID=96639 /ORGANISM=" , Strain NY0313808BC1" /LENGTH=397 /DNA_ID=CAMNT_0050648669 /DNA_START=16 /DNA_END=1209 /DNA_ORIENTATION=+
MSEATFLSAARGGSGADGNGVKGVSFGADVVDDDEEEEEEEEEDAEALAGVSEKLFRIRQYLQRLPQHPFVQYSRINEDIGIDLHLNEDVLQRLKVSELIEIDENEEKIRFKPRVEVHDINSLLKALDRFPDGISIQELEESGPADIRLVVDKAITWGLVIAIRNRNTVGGSSNLLLFPKGPSFLVPLQGKFKAEVSKAKLESTADVRKEVRRGDAIIVGREGANAFNDFDGVDEEKIKDSCFRVSNDTVGSRLEEVNYGRIVDGVLKNFVPYSRSSSSLPAQGPDVEYKRKFTDTKIPIAPAYKGKRNLENVQVYKHGCTNDIREMWREATKRHKYRATDSGAATLNNQLLQRSLCTKEWLERGGSNVKKKPVAESKKRRANNRARISTNAHLIGK